MQPEAAAMTTSPCFCQPFTALKLHDHTDMLCVYAAQSFYSVQPEMLRLTCCVCAVQSLSKMNHIMQDRQLGSANFTWLMDCADPSPSDAELDAFATYGHFIGPDKVCCCCL